MKSSKFKNIQTKKLFKIEKKIWKRNLKKVQTRKNVDIKNFSKIKLFKVKNCSSSKKSSNLKIVQI
jgi:hypothetical protein